MTFQQLSKKNVKNIDDIKHSIPAPWEGSGLSAEQYIEKVTEQLRLVESFGQTDIIKVKSAVSKAVQVITYCQLRLEVERASMMIKALDKENKYGRRHTDTNSKVERSVQRDNLNRSLEPDTVNNRDAMDRIG